MSAHFIPSNGCTIHAVVSHLNEDAPWLVFANSLMTDHTLWDAQADFFGSRYNLLRYDQRGHGLSDVPEHVNFDDLSGDLLTLLDHFGIEQATYIGVSMGVPTGLNFAGRNPGRFTRMILASGQMVTPPTAHQTWQTRIDAAKAHGMAWVADEAIPRWFGAEFIAQGGAEQLRAAAARMSVAGYSACASVLQGYDFESEARNLDVPVLLVAGEKDGALPSVMQNMQAAIKGAEFALVEGAGHIPVLEKASRFNGWVADFLNKT
jgi:3-oxoadipate enol-lactonase